ncbi:MAG: hypothetical protein QXO55_03815 [Candidatus Korarchaeum sp.]
MRAEEIWEEFLRTQDIAKAGRMILELARSLKHEITSFLRGRRERKVKPRGREVKLVDGELVAIRGSRCPPRYPTPREVMEALNWAQEKIREREECLRIAEVSEFDLARHVSVVRSAISKLRYEGRPSLSLGELSRMTGGLVITFLALLFLEREGEVILVQERPFGEIRVILDVYEVLGEREEVV